MGKRSKGWLTVGNNVVVCLVLHPSAGEGGRLTASLLEPIASAPMISQSIKR